MRTLLELPSFWIFFVPMFFVVALYPLLLSLLGRLWPRPATRRPIVPTVSIVIAARNEADKIRQKLDHTLALRYPADRLQIIVASDASDDATDEIVRSYADLGVRLVRAPQRNGKEYAQGLAVAVATGEIVVFTDSATILESELLANLVQNFADPSIGAVSTEDLIVDAAGNPTGEGAYVKYEMWVRRLESQFYSLVGLSGSCFAIRRELCQPWPTDLASDFRSALQTARAGFRSVTDPSARARFVAVASAGAEMRRKVRTFLRGITVLRANWDLMVKFWRYGRFSFQLISHKFLRFVTPILLVVALVASALSDDWRLWVLALLQAIFYGIGFGSGFIPAFQRVPGVRIVHFFTMVQCAMLVAWAKHLRGEQQVTWEPTQRRPLEPRTPPLSGGISRA